MSDKELEMEELEDRILALADYLAEVAHESRVLQEEVERLRTSVYAAGTSAGNERIKTSALQQEVEKLKQLVWDAEPVLLRAISSRDKYKSELEFYADEDRYRIAECGESAISEDNGKRAREALSTEQSK